MLLAGAAIPTLCGAQAVSWAHQNGSLQSNGSITIKSQSGGSYAGQVNPAGAVAKANQSAVTQPPTVIIQATSAGPVFSWATDCFILKFDVYSGQANSYAFGAGKYNATTNTFTGILGAANASQSVTSSVMMSMMTGASIPGSTNAYLVNCGSSVACAYTPSFPNTTTGVLTAVQNLSTVNIPVSKCYP